MVKTKQVSNEFVTRKKPNKGIRGADSVPATNVLRKERDKHNLVYIGCFVMINVSSQNELIKN